MTNLIETLAVGAACHQTLPAKLCVLLYFPSVPFPLPLSVHLTVCTCFPYLFIPLVFFDYLCILLLHFCYIHASVVCLHLYAPPPTKPTPCAGNTKQQTSTLHPPSPQPCILHHPNPPPNRSLWSFPSFPSSSRTPLKPTHLNPSHLPHTDLTCPGHSFSHSVNFRAA